MLKTKIVLLRVTALFVFSVSCSGIWELFGYSATEATPRDDSWWVARHNEKINNVIEKQKIILIGNSITQGWENTNIFNELNKKYDNRITNLGFSGDETQNVIWRLENGEFPVGIDPEYVSLMIGTNNRQSPKEISEGIEKILKIIHKNAPESKILLFSLLPRGVGYKDADTKRNNKVNAIIKEFNGKYNAKYFDISQYYVDDNGILKKTLFTDLLHLSDSGYDIWKDELMKIISSTD